jgi:hypothetical protein
MLICYVKSIKLGSMIFMIGIMSFFLLFDFYSNAFATYSDTVSFNLSNGYVNGDIKSFIATDASDNQTADSITESLGQKINFAPLLASIPNLYLQQGYDFVNGIEGNGSFGFQIPVASAIPGEKDYSPLVQLNFVKWNDDSDARLLKSSEDIEQAQINGEIQIMKTSIVINSPAIQQK